MPEKLGSTITNSELGTITLPTMDELVSMYGQNTASGVQKLLDEGTSFRHIRELDPWTGAKHYEYELPGGQPDAPNIWRYGLGGQWQWQGPGPQPTAGPPKDVPVPENYGPGFNLASYGQGSGGGGQGGGQGSQGGGGGSTFIPSTGTNNNAGTNNNTNLTSNPLGGGGNSGNRSLTNQFPTWYGTIANQASNTPVYPNPNFQTSPYKPFMPERQPFGFFPYPTRP